MVISASDYTQNNTQQSTFKKRNKNRKKPIKSSTEIRLEHARMYALYKMRDRHPEVWNAAIDEVLAIIGKRKAVAELVEIIDGLKLSTHLEKDP